MVDKKGIMVAIRPEGLIEARFSLTNKQNDILDMIFTQLEEDDKTDYIIDIHRYKRLYNTDTSNIYRDMAKAVEGFEGKGLKLIKANDKGKIYFPWFSKIDYKNHEGEIAVSIHPDLKQLFLDVKKRIYYHIKYTLNFGCIYSKRLYYYLKSYEDTGWRVDNLEVLREKLQCPNSYKKYGLFRTNVIDMAKHEINTTSDISFEYEEIFTGRKVTGLKFLVSRKTKYLIDEVAATSIYNDKESFPYDTIKSMFTEELSVLDAKKIYDCAGKNIDVIKQKYKIAKVTKNIDNIVAWMIGAIKGDYQMPIVKKQLSTFNDYEQRNYDFDDLEKKLLGWDMQNTEDVKRNEAEQIALDLDDIREKA